MLISILGAQTFNPGNWHNQFKVALGLDLSSGTQVVLKAATPNGAVPSAQAMQASVGVLENRVNGTGNSGAQVQTQGNDQITVTVPGKAATSVVNLIDTTAKLAFRPVLLSEAYTGVSTAPAAKATGTPSPTPSGSGEQHRHAHRVADAVGQLEPERHRQGVDLRRLRQAGEQPDCHPLRHGIGEDVRHRHPHGERHPERHRQRQPGCHRLDEHHLRRPVGGQRGHDEEVRRPGLQARPEPVHRE